MTKDHVPLWYKWAEVEHVKSLWFQEGYSSVDKIHETLEGNGYDYPFIIYADDKPIGYIQTSDLYAYRNICPKPEGLFTEEEEGTFCLDLYIGEKDYLGKGIGTEVVKQFTRLLFDRFKAKKVKIDPFKENKIAIRCYEKAGYKIVDEAHDGVNECLILEKLNFIS